MTSSINKTPDNVPDPELLKAMEFVAKMKASADKVGAQFIGGFITEDGQRFVQTNLDDPEEVERRLPPELKWTIHKWLKRLHLTKSWRVGLPNHQVRVSKLKANVNVLNPNQIYK